MPKYLRTSPARIAASITGATYMIMIRYIFFLLKVPEDSTSSSIYRLPTTCHTRIHVPMATMGIITELDIKSKKSRNCIFNTVMWPQGP